MTLSSSSLPDDSKLIELMFRVYPLEWSNKSADQLYIYMDPLYILL